LFEVLREFTPKLKYSPSNAVTDPSIAVLAACGVQGVDFWSMKFSNSQIATIIQVFDFVSMVVIFVAYKLIENMQSDFANTYDK
jgi:hypothetical protein